MRKVLAWPGSYVVAGAAILALDVLTGPYLQFPVLFVLPVALAAWYCGRGTALALALGLPALRLLFHEQVEASTSLVICVANALVRMTVLTTLAYFVNRCARQAFELDQRLHGLVTLCAWNRTVEYQGEWLSFESYLERRFGLHTTHGVSPQAVEKIMAGLPGSSAPPERP